MQHNSLIHLISGGIGGTTAAILTCPLEVVKTRLQSSYLSKPYSSIEGQSNRSPGLMRILSHIVKTEGVGGLFKGVGPTLVGVIPSRAIYFGMYAKSKNFYNNIFSYETPLVHGFSAFTAGVLSSTLTNPIWFIKTRIQLNKSNLTISNCVKTTLKNDGVRSFFKGVTASYYGLIETAINFVLYEHFKKKFEINHSNLNLTFKDGSIFLFCTLVSKSIASCIGYPHEVARTRIRERGNHYKSFWPTLYKVAHEEGFHVLYRGLSTHLIRNIPNTLIIMSTYEMCVHFFYKKTN
ncbi:Solute carrier family 25 member 33 [Intoshia linei]|uniref:Solute carrier family 25 member 33 n=1 Tax=Intoshia linei TaxID=1819745 RepID=A0A177B2G0_9BILA|nr:Solute carrier family 25 member 33 [Intoshia linei]